MIKTDGVKNLTLAVGSYSIDMATKFLYHGDCESLVKGYGHDILYPISTYFVYRLFKDVTGWTNKYATAAFVFSGFSLFEFAQKADLYPGTYDPKDFLAYATGTALALGIDSITSIKKKQVTSIEDKVK